jgi:hypothetical protein
MRWKSAATLSSRSWYVQNIASVPPRLPLTESTSPPGTQHGRRLLDPACGIEPVPRVSARDQVEPAARGTPGLERRDLDRYPMSTREVGHPLVDLYAKHPHATAGQGSRDLAGAAADVEHVNGPECGQIVDERMR